MFLVEEELYELVEQGVIKIGCLSQIKDISVDVTLHKDIYIEDVPYLYEDKVTIIPGISKHKVKHIDLSKQDYVSYPQDFIIGSINEIINMPNNLTGFLFLKSVIGRAGLQHSLAIPIKPGWSGRLVLELTNSYKYHNILLKENMLIAQIMFTKHSLTKGYRGKYQNQTIIF